MKKWYQLSPLASDIFISLYIIGTLLFRFQIEAHFRGFFILSIAFGAFALLFIWALIKVKILNPNWFGLLHKS
ncbi:MAG: hypothetical protein N4A45_08690 [Flavobacteriales bacterium]|jgi:hypothetical protein|nr:hypothetical protein [Flavobacteriales bacterium]